MGKYRRLRWSVTRMVLSLDRSRDNPDDGGNDDDDDDDDGVVSAHIVLDGSKGWKKAVESLHE